MIEPNYIALSNESIEAIEEHGKKHLDQLDKDLQNLYKEQDILNKTCTELRNKIIKHEKQLEEINDDINILEELKNKLNYIPEYFNNFVTKFGELDVLIERKRLNYFREQRSLRELNENINETRKNLSSLKQCLEEKKNLLKEKQERVAIYHRWITILVDRGNNLFVKINELDEDLKSTILESTDISDPAILNLKVVVDYKRFHIDRKIRWYNDTVATLDNTKEILAEVNNSVETLNVEIIDLEKKYSDNIVALENIILKQNSVKTLYEKIEVQWSQYIEMQETYNRKEKLRTTEELVFVHWKEYCEIQQEENNDRNKLFSKSLDLSILESNIAFIVTKREEFEAEIALRLSDQL